MSLIKHNCIFFYTDQLHTFLLYIVSESISKTKPFPIFFSLQSEIFYITGPTGSQNGVRKHDLSPPCSGTILQTDIQHLGGKGRRTVTEARELPHEAHSKKQTKTQIIKTSIHLYLESLYQTSKNKYKENSYSVEKVNLP